MHSDLMLWSGLQARRRFAEQRRAMAITAAESEEAYRHLHATAWVRSLVSSPGLGL